MNQWLSWFNGVDVLNQPLSSAGYDITRDADLKDREAARGSKRQVWHDKVGGEQTGTTSPNQGHDEEFDANDDVQVNSTISGSKAAAARQIEQDRRHEEDRS